MNYHDEFNKIKQILTDDFIEQVITKKYNLTAKNEFKITHSVKDCSDSYICINWKLLTDPDRPNKRSKDIKIMASEEFLEDHMISYNFNYENWFEKRLNNFEPNHDALNYELKPADIFMLCRDS